MDCKVIHIIVGWPLSQTHDYDDDKIKYYPCPYHKFKNK